MNNFKMEYYGIHHDSTIEHHGILGMRWGVRRYQNRDGSLTAEGKKRYGYDRYERDYSKDSVIPKGTKVTRAVSLDRIEEYSDPDVGGSAERGKQYVKTVLERDEALRTTYVSVDSFKKQTGRVSGSKFYASWFSEDLMSPNQLLMKTYELKRNAKVAAGEKVLDKVLKELGPEYLRTALEKEPPSVNDATMEYTHNLKLHDRVNDYFRKLGYDAVEDINDTKTEMPIVVLNKDILGDPVKMEKGKDYIEKTFGFKYVD